MPTKKVQPEVPQVAADPVEAVRQSAGLDINTFQALVAALTMAIQSTKPVEKKNAINRKSGTPWDPTDGSKKIKLKRKVYQHGLEVDPDRETNETIGLMNELKPGVFCDGHVRVVRRRDKGVDIDYPIKTAAQRLKLVNGFGIKDFNDLLRRCIDEANNPKTYVNPDDF
jgi:hypothetical protein